jgi:hypothetical protein
MNRAHTLVWHHHVKMGHLLVTQSRSNRPKGRRGPSQSTVCSDVALRVQPQLVDTLVLVKPGNHDRMGMAITRFPDDPRRIEIRDLTDELLPTSAARAASMRIAPPSRAVSVAAPQNSLPGLARLSVQPPG